MPSCKLSLHLLALLAGVHATSASTANNSSNNSSIKWTECPSALVNESTRPIQCARYAVPLDYTDKSSDETVKLDLIRVPATRQPSRGSIILNFGGPGLTALETTSEYGWLLNMLSGGQYDLVSFDPRGTGAALPFECFTSKFDSERLQEFSGFYPQPHDERALGQTWAAATVFGQRCAAAQNKTGSLIGTAFAARDIVSIADALGEKDKIRYWGFSYGTTLGATLISMFPEKMERVILDGVQNPHEYYHGNADFQERTQSDQLFSAIFEHCIKNADKCALAHRGKTAAELERLFWGLYDNLTYLPVALPAIAVVDQYLLNGFAAQTLYQQAAWPGFALAVDALLDASAGNDSKLLALVAVVGSPSSSSSYEKLLSTIQRSFQARTGIHCSDRVARLASLDQYRPVQRRLAGISRVMGGVDASTDMTCAQWSFVAKERYVGDFRVTPRQPVLIVGNSCDGHTPIVSARNLSAGFEGSTVLEVNGYGHTSFGLPSTCTAQKYAAYWINGTMPAKGSVCQVDLKPFTDVTWTDVAIKIGWPVEQKNSSIRPGTISSRMVRGMF